MEDDAKRFLQRVVWSMTAAFLWLLFTLGIGMYFGWMVPDQGLRLSNLIFYAWVLLITGGLLYFLARIWKEKFPHG